MKEAGLQCLLDILYKIEQDRADGNFKGNLQNDGTRKDDMKLNQLFKMGVDQGIDVTTLLLQYFNNFSCILMTELSFYDLFIINRRTAILKFSDF